MSISRRDAIDRIEGQRSAIREHIDKYYSYPDPIDKEYALKTIYRCQDEIESFNLGAIVT